MTVIARDGVASDHLVYAWPFPIGVECEVSCSEDESVVMCPAWVVGGCLGPGRHLWRTPDPSRPVSAYFVLNAPVEVQFDLITSFIIPSMGMPVRLRATGSLQVACTDPALLVAQFVGLPFDNINEGVLRSVARSVERMLARLLTRRVVMAGTPIVVTDASMLPSIVDELVAYNPTAGSVFGIELVRMGHLNVIADDGSSPYLVPPMAMPRPIERAPVIDRSADRVASGSIERPTDRLAPIDGYAPRREEVAASGQLARPAERAPVIDRSADRAVSGSIERPPERALQPTERSPTIDRSADRAVSGSIERPPERPNRITNGDAQRTPPIPVEALPPRVRAASASEAAPLDPPPIAKVTPPPIVPMPDRSLRSTQQGLPPIPPPIPPPRPPSSPPAAASGEIHVRAKTPSDIPAPRNAAPIEVQSGEDITQPGLSLLRTPVPGSLRAPTAPPVAPEPAPAPPPTDGASRGSIVGIVPGPNGLMQSATVRQLLQGYYELEVGSSGETIWVPMNGVVPD